MKVIKYHLGTYTHHCPVEQLFTFHLKLRDLDQIFCDTNSGYIYNNGEIYVEAHLVKEIARQVGEKVLIELCQLDESAIRSDTIRNVLNPLPNVDLEDELEMMEADLHVVVGLHSGHGEVQVKTEELIDSSGFHIPRLSKSPQLDKTVRRAWVWKGATIYYGSHLRRFITSSNEPPIPS
ncbi:hypothetical protein K493DRAFT_411067 [Basidiobolus meristosporus CBS 931.73]|uniref:Uncharacterized protein n=1 Tax=Basidiobolus meristosporus CBS 931.73 TaxID=1314790 RepID=A0A1Y1XRF6_9FUNG|nr:hypothetical protein K493DRAFT_411067 [Basidiobolus meristosporus CBS 931.73]|eukprot:ORX88342.1 hypothetical protein K493DRAFT_411067 [Basidiobolus meristosporus CBS 931.73]